MRPKGGDGDGTGGTHRSVPGPRGPVVPPGAPGGPGFTGDVNTIRQLNPGFDPRITNIGGGNPAIDRGTLRRGNLISKLPAGTQKQLHMVQFLYNPSVVQVDYSMNMDVAPPPTVGSPKSGDDSERDAQNPKEPKDPSTAPLYMSEGTVGNLSLLFDRTFEVNDRTPTAASIYGAYVDVLAFYIYLMMIDLEDTRNVMGLNLTEGAGLPWEMLFPKNPLMYRTGFLNIGGPLSFYGYINSFSVEYSHWSYDMVPMRAAVGINFTTQSILPTPAKENDPAAEEKKNSGIWHDIGEILKHPIPKGLL